jgi:glucose-1-phosphate thymidylyltransferase
MNQNIKIVIPTAGWATSMRPQTWSKPKPLVSVAGKTVMEHLLATFQTIPTKFSKEYVIIYSPGLGETQIPSFMKEHYPDLVVNYVLQPVMKGQSDALELARSYLNGPMIVCFSDTLMETDFSFLAGEQAEGVAWVKHVPDPRRFGVAEVDSHGWVTRLVEKPTSLENDSVVIGCYYLRDGQALISAIHEQVKRGTSLKGEFFLTDALNIMIERGLKMRTQTVDVWLDTGTIDATLETNRYLLRHGQANRNGKEKMNGVQIISPVFIHPSSQVSNSVIGPDASIGPDCIISNAHIENCILESGVKVEAVSLESSFIGRMTSIQGRSASDPALKLNIGDNSSVTIK